MITRRCLLIRSVPLVGSGGLAWMLKTDPARATPDSLQAAIRAMIGDATPRAGRITLDLPPLVENGNAVPMTVSVDSPMSEADHVKTIHVFNEKNPQPQVITATLSPRAGKASLSTRIKLADAQRVVAVAEMSDGSFWSESAHVIVTIAACVEGLQ